MKKIVCFVFLFLYFVPFSKAFFDLETLESAESFINSPSYFDLKYIENLEQKYCEEAFLDAYRRREFSEEENFICSDFFARKIEDELNYKKLVLNLR